VVIGGISDGFGGSLRGQRRELEDSSNFSGGSVGFFVEDAGFAEHGLGDFAFGEPMGGGSAGNGDNTDDAGLNEERRALRAGAEGNVGGGALEAVSVAGGGGDGVGFRMDDETVFHLADVKAIVISNAARKPVETLGKLGVVRVGDDAAYLG